MLSVVKQGKPARAEPYRVRMILERVSAGGRAYKVGEVQKDILLAKEDVPKALKIMSE